MTPVEIFTRPGCGWAERNYAALVEKGVPFRTVMSAGPDGAKTSEFLEVSPYATTPALRFEGAAVWESAVINEYIDDRFPSPPLRPADPLGRARVRLMVHHCDNVLIAGLKALVQGDSDPGRVGAVRQVARLQEWWSSRGASGPFWMGARISLVDIALHTYFQAREATRAIHGSAVPELAPPLAGWRDAIAAHPSIQAAAEIARDLSASPQGVHP